jgi:hypothetical protein
MRQKLSLDGLFFKLLLASAILLSAICLGSESNAANAYGDKVFLRDGKHLYFGAQPASVPSGVITAVMEKDSILKEELSKIGKTLIFSPFLNGPETNN